MNPDEVTYSRHVIHLDSPDVGEGNVTLRTSGNATLDVVWINSTLSPTLDSVLGIYFLCTFILSLTLNGLVLLTLFRRPQPITKLEIYVINMSVCHMIHVTFAFPSVIIAAFRHGWHLNLTLCTFEACVLFFCGCASIGNLTTMSLMRLVKTCWAGTVRLTLKLVISTIIIAYVNAAVWSFSPLLGWGSYGPEPYGLSCTLAWTELPVSYLYSMFIVGFLAPVLLITLSYVNIVCVVCKNSLGSKFRTNRHRMDIYITKMAFIMCLCFIIEWTPYAILSLLYINGSINVPTIISVGAPVLAKTSTWTNPVVYFLSIKRLRDDVWTHALCCRKVSDRGRSTEMHLTSLHVAENVKKGKDVVIKNSCSAVIICDDRTCNRLEVNTYTPESRSWAL